MAPSFSGSFAGSSSFLNSSLSCLCLLPGSAHLLFMVTPTLCLQLDSPSPLNTSSVSPPHGHTSHKMPKAELLLCLRKHVLPETVPVSFHGISGQKIFESSGPALLLTPTSNPELDLDTVTHLPPELHPVVAGSSPAFSLDSQPQPLAFSSLSTQLSLSQVASLLRSITDTSWSPGLPQACLALLPGVSPSPQGRSFYSSLIFSVKHSKCFLCVLIFFST